MVDYKVQGSVAVLEVNNPPVNALSYAVRTGLNDGIDRAVRDRNVKAVVVCGKGSTFPAGADIREFAKPKREPWLPEIGHKMEKSNKPVIAAIHGTCLGGGLEVALFCHYRIALKTARVGFPEVNIGLLPGACGTQRLPRVTGLQVAMDMISSGRHVPAEQAKKYGIIDEIVSGDIINEGIKFAQRVIGQKLDGRRLQYKSVPNTGNAQQMFEKALATVTRKYKGFEAPVLCLKAVKASVDLPYEKGMDMERAYFQQLIGSGQSRAQQYAFFAERTVARWEMPSGSYKTATPQTVKSVAVLGAGTMGSGIAVCVLSAGIPCFLVEQNEKFLQNGMKMIKSIMEGSVRLGKVSPEVGRKAATLLKPTINYSDLKDVDLVIEAVFENLALKKEIFGKLDQICKPNAILASNTSTLDIDLIAAATKRPDKVIGMHFFAPAYHMKLLENIYGKMTSPSTAATVMKFSKVINKIPILVKTCPGFLANRMNGPFGTEAGFLVEEGAQPSQVDRVLEDFGMPIGPFKVRDLSGIDVGWRIKQEVAKSLGVKTTFQTKFMNGERYCSLNDRLYALGRMGRKNGKGWYKYEKAGGKEATEDEEVTEVIEKHCRELGIERRQISSQEIIERMMFACINEGFKILEDGIATRPEDIDVCYLYGFSFPRYLGGPMFYANNVGLQRVYERICYYHENFPYSSHWVPSRLLRKLARKSVPINEWMAYATGSKL